MDRETIIKGLEIERKCVSRDCDRDCGACDLVQDQDWLLSVYNGALKLLKEQEPIKPTINEYGEAYCVCGENVGIIPNSKNLPKILSKYCSECGRRMKWE